MAGKTRSCNPIKLPRYTRLSVTSLRTTFNLRFSFSTMPSVRSNVSRLSILCLQAYHSSQSSGKQVGFIISRPNHWLESGSLSRSRNKSESGLKTIIGLYANIRSRRGILSTLTKQDSGLAVPEDKKSSCQSTSRR